MHETELPLHEKILVYSLYIAVSCLLTSGLNIIHTKHLLGIPLKPEAFIVPVFAGLFFRKAFDAVLVGRVVRDHDVGDKQGVKQSDAGCG